MNYEALFLSRVLGLTLAVEKAWVRQVVVEMGSGVEMACNQELGMATVDRAQVLFQLITWLTSGLTNIEEAT